MIMYSSVFGFPLFTFHTACHIQELISPEGWLSPFLRWYIWKCMCRLALTYIFKYHTIGQKGGPGRKPISDNVTPLVPFHLQRVPSIKEVYA